jgi:exopolyphosphatase/guanosine-5'-triphosphate,3'-diphosphate pyrophosphatase
VRVAAVGTAALRRARNASVFLDETKRRLGLEVAVISGEEEGRLAFEAVARGREEEGAAAGRLLVLDIGGGSTEVIAGEGRRLDWARSLDLGSVRLTERFLLDDPPLVPQRQALVAQVRAAFAALPEPPGAGPIDLVGIAGTNTTLAAMKAGLRVYDAEAIRRTPIAPGELDDLIARLATMPAAARLALPGLEPGREDVILAGAVIAREALARFRMAAMSVSDRGVRHGVIYRMAVPGDA